MADDSYKIEIEVDASGAVKDVKSADEALQKLTETAKGADSKGFSSLQKTLITLGTSLQGGKVIFDAVSSVISKTAGVMKDLIDKGDKMDDLTNAFTNFGGSADALNKASEASGGLINKMDLMAAANKAFVADLPGVNQNMAFLADAATRLGDTVGIDATEAFDALNNAMITGQTRSLKMMGITISLDEAEATYAKQLGTTADKLSEAGQKEAVRLAILDKLQKKLTTLPPAEDDVNKALTRINNTMTEYQTKAGTVINNNEQLRTSLNNFNKEMKDIDFEAFARGLAICSAAVVDLSTKLLAIGNGKAKAQFQALGETIAADVGWAADWVTTLFDTNKATSAWEAKIYAINKRLKEKTELQTQAQAEDKKTVETTNTVTESLKKEDDMVKDVTSSVLSMADAVKKAYNDSTFKSKVEALYSELARQDASQQDVIESLNRLGKEYVISGGKMEDFLSLVGDAPTAIKEEKQEIDKLAGSLSQLYDIDDLYGDPLGSFIDNLESSDLEVTQLTTDLQKLYKIYAALGILGEKNADVSLSFGSELGSQIAASSGAAGMAVTGATGAAWAQMVVQMAQGVLDLATQIIIDGTESLSGKWGETIGGIIGGSLGSSAGALIDAISAGGGREVSDKERRSIAGMVEEIIQEVNFQIYDQKGNVQNFSDVITDLDFTAGSDFDTYLNGIDTSVRRTFGGIMAAYAQMNGIDWEQGFQVGESLLYSFSGDIDNLRLLVSTLGISYEDTEAAMIEMFLAGDMGAMETMDTLAAMANAFEPGLVAIGDVQGAFDQLIASGARGQVSLTALQNIAVEALETNATTLEDLKARLLATGQYSVEQIQQLFDALANNGITSMSDLQDASQTTLINILADMERSGFEFTDTLALATDQVTELAGQWEAVPDDYQTDYTINVKAKYDSSTTENLVKNGELPGISLS